METKTDNSFLKVKVDLRTEYLPAKNNLKVLDCFAGQGIIWNEVKKQSGRSDIKVVGIEKERNKNLSAIYGDNIKILPCLDLNDYDIIDIDAYGTPAKQIEIIADKKYKGLIFFTAITVSMGAISNSVYDANKISREMRKKCPTIFRQKYEQFFINFLFDKLDVKCIMYKRIQDKSSVKLYGVIEQN